GHVQQAERQGDRIVIEAVGGAQPPAQVHSVPLGDVDADVLHQPRRQESADWAKENIAEGKGRAARGIRQGMTTRPCLSPAISATLAASAKTWPNQIKCWGGRHFVK